MTRERFIVVCLSVSMGAPAMSGCRVRHEVGEQHGGGTGGDGGTAGRAGGTDSDGGTGGRGGLSGSAGNAGVTGSAGNGGVSGSAGNGGVSGSAGNTGVSGSAGNGGVGGSAGSAGGGGTSAVECNPKTYEFITGSLIPYTMTGADRGSVETLLVPLKNPDPDETPEHECDFEDVYHLFTASVVMAEAVRRDDLDTAKKITEFYLQLFENPLAHPELWNDGAFIGFPEVYKNKLGCEHLDELNIERDPGNPDFEANSIVYGRMKDAMKQKASPLVMKIIQLSGLSSDCASAEIDELEDFEVLDALNKAVTEIDGELEDIRLRHIVPEQSLCALFAKSGGSVEMLHEEVRDTYNAIVGGTFSFDPQNPDDVYEAIRAYMFLNRSILKRFFHEAFAYDDLYKVQYRGSGPTSWWAIALFKLLAVLDPDDSADRALILRIEDLLDAIGDWLVWLQNEGLEEYLWEDKGVTLDDVPWLDGGVVGALNERTLKVISGPYTEASAAGYSVLRQLQFRYMNRDADRFEKYKAAADRLAEWFRYVVDGETGRAYVGRELDGSHVSGLPETIAEAIDPYAFLIGAGVVDADLAMRFLDRVVDCDARMTLTDDRGVIVSGLRFGPQGDAPYWGPHAQVTQQAVRLGHEMGELWLEDLNNAQDHCRLSVFTPDGSLDDYDRVGDWKGVKNDQVWLGRRIWDLEVMAWYSMLADKTYNMLGPEPIPWDPEVFDGDPLLLPPPAPRELDLIALAPDDGAEPSSPIAGASDDMVEPWDDHCGDTGGGGAGGGGTGGGGAGGGGAHLVVAQGETRNGGPSYLITATDSGAEPCTKILPIRYLSDDPFPGNEYLFFIKKLSGDFSLEIELKDEHENQSHFFVEDELETGAWQKATINMLGLWNDGVDRRTIGEILIHITGVGELEIDGFADPTQLMP